ncbi:MAG TPA: SDR family NAD(P)-dependent oxidoreductase, partial [Dehalococcoidia bacterium]
MMLERIAAGERALEGRVAVVTGGNSGIGAATARAFAAAGAHVAILARREVEGRSVEAELRAAGSRAIFVACDVTRRDDIERAVEA